MTPDQVSIVKRTWAEVVPIADQAVALFYHRLFAIDPALRELFAGTDRAAQHRKLVAALALAVGAALLWTLEQGLGEAWTPEAAAAWSAAYAEIAGAMTAADAPRQRSLAA
jgi:nitric oxide dioxygenase